MLLLLIAVVPVIATLGVRGAVLICSAACPRGRRSSSASSCSTLSSARILGWAFINFDWVAGLFWFLGKTFGFVFLFVWMRGTLPRVRIDQLMGFAWKWLLPASLLNLFVTALAIIVVRRRDAAAADERPRCPASSPASAWSRAWP